MSTLTDIYDPQGKGRAALHKKSGDVDNMSSVGNPIAATWIFGGVSIMGLLYSIANMLGI